MGRFPSCSTGKVREHSEAEDGRQAGCEVQDYTGVDESLGELCIGSTASACRKDIWNIVARPVCVHRILGLQGMLDSKGTHDDPYGNECILPPKGSCFDNGWEFVYVGGSFMCV